MKNCRAVVIIFVLVLAITGNALAKSIFGLSTQEEVVIGQQIAKDIERSLPLYRNRVYEARLERIARKLVRASTRHDISYIFNIIDKDELNAFATFGGYIYIYKGAMDKSGDDDELASILAHEIGHISAKHLAKGVEQKRAFGLWFTVLDFFFLRKQEARDNIHQLISIGYDIMQRGYSRKDEFEADRLGVRFSHKAGYDPLAAIRVLKKVEKEETRRGRDPFSSIGILRTHPYVDERIEAVLSEVAAIKAEESAGDEYEALGD